MAKSAFLFLALMSVGEATAPLHLFTHHPVHLCVHPSSHPCIRSFSYPCAHPPVHLSTWTSIYPLTHRPTHLPTRLPACHHLPTHLSVHPPSHRFTHPSHPATRPSIFPPVHPYRLAGTTSAKFGGPELKAPEASLHILCTLLFLIILLISFFKITYCFLIVKVAYVHYRKCGHTGCLRRHC